MKTSVFIIIVRVQRFPPSVKNKREEVERYFQNYIFVN